METGLDEVRFVAAAGGLGSTGIHAPSLQKSLECRPHFIACDAGTTDSGPFYLGSGAVAYSKESVKHDLALMLQAGRQLSVPVIIGSAGTGGGDGQVDWVFDLARAVASELGGTMRVALVYAEQDKGYLKGMLDGRSEGATSVSRSNSGSGSDTNFSFDRPPGAGCKANQAPS